MFNSRSGMSGKAVENVVNAHLVDPAESACNIRNNHMEPHRLGRQGLTVSAMGLGCMGMSDAYGPADEGESVATIHRALELGIDLLDTSDAYGPFTNAELRGQRETVR